MTRDPFAEGADSWLIPVRDAADRPGKELTVRAEDHEVVIVAPPPGTARLGAQEMTRLINVLRAARGELFRRASGGRES